MPDIGEAQINMTREDWKMAHDAVAAHRDYLALCLTRIMNVADRNSEHGRYENAECLHIVMAGIATCARRATEKPHQGEGR